MICFLCTDTSMQVATGQPRRYLLQTLQFKPGMCEIWLVGLSCLQVSSALTVAGLSNIIDTTGNTIGKRYARTDEIGVPYAVTVDFDSLAEVGGSTVTLRERDTMSQVGEV